MSYFVRDFFLQYVARHGTAQSCQGKGYVMCVVRGKSFWLLYVRVCGVLVVSGFTFW